MDGFGQIGKRLRTTKDRAEFSLKREVPPQISQERIRDLFDSQNPVQAVITTPDAAKRVMVDFNFGRKLPSLECCGDCLCGITESYTSDSLIGNNLYVTTPYVPGSVVLYIDGVKADSGVDFIESDPVNKQLTILAPSPLTFVVSYVYTVGNCTESVCIDERFECLGYTFMSNLATVFSDRFDRSATVNSSGSCGGWFIQSGNTYTRTTPLMGNGEVYPGTNEGIWLGGTDKTVGKSVEVLVGINLDNISGTQTFSMAGAFSDNTGAQIIGTVFQLTRLTATTVRLSIFVRARTFESLINQFGVIDTDSIKTVGATVTTDITHTGGRHWFRFAQMPGAAASKLWPQFTPEPSGAQLTATMVDINLQSPIDPDEVQPREFMGLSINRIYINCDAMEAIMVGAALDTGQWGLAITSQGAEGFYCAEIPDGLTRFGYNCGVNGTSTVTIGGVGEPLTQWTYSYPTNFGNPPDDPNQGRIQSYDQRIMAIDTGRIAYGHPSAIRLRGQLAASLWDTPHFVEIKKYPNGTLTFGNANGFQGGQTLATYMLQPDGTPQDIDIFVPLDTNEQFVRIGVHVPNIVALAQQQSAFYYGPFLFPNNFGNLVTFYHLRAEALPSADCTTGPFCDDCTTTRCPELVDNFDTYTTTSAFGTGDYVRVPTQGAAYTNDKGTGTQVTYSGGVQTVSFQGSTQKFLNVDYASPFDCNYTGEEGTWEAYFEVRLGTPTGAETGTFSFGSVDIDYTSSTNFPGSFGISPNYNSVGTSTLVPGTWFSVRNRIEGTDFLLKIWPAGTPEPTSWTFTSTVTSFPSSYVMGSFSSGNSTPTFTTETRAVHITKVV